MNTYYYINDMNQQVGPVSAESLRQAGVTRDTMVWHAGMPQWQRAGDVEELSFLFSPQRPVYGPKQPQYGPQAEYGGRGYGQPQGYGPQGYGQPQAGYGYGNRPPKPDSWMWLAICSTLLCCLPLGIVSIIYASQVDSSYNRGDYQGAKQNADKAKTWGWVAVGAGLLAGIFYLIYFFIIVAAGASSALAY